MESNTRLTKREVEVIIGALEFALAAGIDGGPFERDTDRESDQAWRAAQSASSKLKERLYK